LTLPNYNTENPVYRDYPGAVWYH